MHISVALLLLAGLVAAQTPTKPKCRPPTLAPLQKCVGGSFEACTSGIKCTMQYPHSCYCHNSRVSQCAKACGTRTPPLPKCPPYPCPTPTLIVDPPPPACTGGSFEKCVGSRACTQQWPQSCYCQNGIIATCAAACGVPPPPLAPCPKVDPPVVVEEGECPNGSYEACLASTDCPANDCNCENARLTRCGKLCGVRGPPLQPCPKPTPPPIPSYTPDPVDTYTPKPSQSLWCKCAKPQQCLMAWPQSCYCELEQRKQCAMLCGQPWNQEKEEAECKLPES